MSVFSQLYCSNLNVIRTEATFKAIEQTWGDQHQRQVSLWVQSVSGKVLPVPPAGCSDHYSHNMGEQCPDDWCFSSMRRHWLRVKFALRGTERLPVIFFFIIFVSVDHFTVWLLSLTSPDQTAVKWVWTSFFHHHLPQHPAVWLVELLWVSSSAWLLFPAVRHSAPASVSMKYPCSASSLQTVCAHRGCVRIWCVVQLDTKLQKHPRDTFWVNKKCISRRAAAPFSCCTLTASC